jgi:NADH-quinone oxidoreductase subunit C
LSSPEAPEAASTEPVAAETTEDEAEAVETDEVRDALLAEVTERLGADAIAGSHIAAGQDLWIRSTTAAWGDLAHVLRHDLGFAYFTFVSAIDWMPSPFGRSMDAEVDMILESAPDADKEPEPIEQGVAGGETRFQVFARVYSVDRHLGLTLKADVPDDTMTVPTWTGTYRGADWHEREAWEMYGISFDGHPGLRKLYLPGDFEGYPLRKDFPLLARHMKPWPGIVDVEPMPGEDAADGTDGDASDSGDEGGE